jgi:hypothetical protein
MRTTGEPVDEFLAGITNERRRADSYKLCDLMRDVAGVQPEIWASRIVGFGSYHYKYESGHEGDAPLISFAPQAAQLAIYLIADFDQRHQTHTSQLGKYKAGKSCLYVKRLEDVDMDVLRVLLERSVRVRRGVDQTSRGNQPGD